MKDLANIPRRYSSQMSLETQVLTLLKKPKYHLLFQSTNENKEILAAIIIQRNFRKRQKHLRQMTMAKKRIAQIKNEAAIIIQRNFRKRQQRIRKIAVEMKQLDAKLIAQIEKELTFYKRQSRTAFSCFPKISFTKKKP